MFAETEGFLTAIQDQVILTRNYKKYILRQPDTDELCRRCGKESETIQHITAACEQLAPTEYVKTHDGLAKTIHQKLAEAAEFIDGKVPQWWSRCYAVGQHCVPRNFILHIYVLGSSATVCCTRFRSIIS